MRVLTSQALHAVTANLSDVSKSNDIANLEAGDIGAELLDSSNTLVSQSDVGVSEVKICAANTGMCHLDEDIVGAELSVDSLANGDIALSSAVDVKGNLAAHFGCDCNVVVRCFCFCFACRETEGIQMLSVEVAFVLYCIVLYC